MHSCVNRSLGNITSILPSTFTRRYVQMSVVITNPASSRILSVIRLPKARGHNTFKIHHQLCERYRPTTKSYYTLAAENACKDHRMSSVHAFLNYFNQEEDEFFSHIVTGYET